MHFTISCSQGSYHGHYLWYNLQSALHTTDFHASAATTSYFYLSMKVEHFSARQVPPHLTD